MDRPAGTKLSPKLSRSWVPHSPRSAGDDQLCAPRPVLVQELCVKKCQAGGKAISRTPMCWKGKWMGWSLEGGNPFKSMRNSARKQQKEQFSRNYREEKKIWQEIQPGRWSTSFWANWMFQLKMTELRSFKSSQNLINFSWMEAAHILKTWQTPCSLEITCSPGSMPSWHQMALPAMDQRKKAQKGPPGILCYICVQNRVCREEMDAWCYSREGEGSWEEQTSTGEQDTETKEQAVKKTNIKERSLWKTRVEQWKWREGGRRKRGREERPLCAWEKDNKSCGLLSRRTIPALFTVCSFNLVNF